MSDEKGYNGWTNYETWNLALWIDNEQGSQEFWREAAEGAYRDAEKGEDRARDATIAVADMLKDETEENSPVGVTGFYADILNAAISEVNWREIAKHWVDEAAIEIDAEEKQDLIDALEFELSDAHKGEGNEISFDDWISAMAANDAGTFQDAAKELIALRRSAAR